MVISGTVFFFHLYPFYMYIFMVFQALLIQFNFCKKQNESLVYLKFTMTPPKLNAPVNIFHF